MSDRDRLQNSRYLDDYYPYRRWRDTSYSPVERRYRGSYLDGLRQNRLGTYSSRYTSPVSDAATRVVDYDRLQSLRYYLNSLNFRNDDSDDSIRHSDPSDSSMYLSSRYATDESRYGRRHSPLHSRALDSHVSSPRSSRASEPYYRNPRFNSDSGSRLSPENSRYTSPRNSFNEERTLDYRDPQEIEPPNAFSIPAARESRMIAQKPRPVVYTKTIRDEDDLDSERESETQMVATKPKPFVYSRSITDEQMEALESRFGHHRCRRSRRRKWNCPLFKRREPGSNSFAYTTSVTEEEAVNLSQSVFDPSPRRRSLFNCRRSRRSREDNPVDDDELEHARDHRRRPRSPYTSAASVQTEVPDKLPAGRNASTSVTSMERERIMGTQTDLYLTCSNFEKAISQVEAVMECIAEEENDKEPPPSRIPRMVRKRSKSTPSAIGKESPTIPSNPSTENSDK